MVPLSVVTQGCKDSGGFFPRGINVKWNRNIKLILSALFFYFFFSWDTKSLHKDLPLSSIENSRLRVFPDSPGRLNHSCTRIVTNHCLLIIVLQWRAAQIELFLWIQSYDSSLCGWKVSLSPASQQNSILLNNRSGWGLVEDLCYSSGSKWNVSNWKFTVIIMFLRKICSIPLLYLSSLDIYCFSMICRHKNI